MIEAKALTMQYGPVVALRDASFQVRSGEVVGLLGPNGAGKSTTMKILTTFLHPTSGTATVAGHDILEDPLAVRREIGYLPEVVPLYMDMEVRDYLGFVGRARGVTGQRLRTRVSWVVEHAGLVPVYRKLIGTLSKGYRQRTGLAQALIHDPSVVILDEPTSGLDPRQILDVRRLIRHLAETKTVILSTHILHEAEATSDRLVVISHGAITGVGTVDELRSLAHERSRVVVSVASRREDVEPKLYELAGPGNVRFEGKSADLVTFVLTTDDVEGTMREVGRLSRRERWELGALTARPVELEDVFLALSTAEGRGGGRSEAA